MAEVARPKSDREIQQDVVRELAWDPRVDPRVEQAEIRVEVHRGVVRLTGSVSSWGKRMAAQEAAYCVAGVLDVANDIEVTVPAGLARTDPDIAQAVRHALTWDVFVPDQRIRSTVTDGWVTLDGEVDFWTEREDAERAVRNLTGVRGVTNRIAVTVTPPRDLPRDVRRAIEDALERRAHRQAERVRVDVHGGRVTLSGRVRSWEERRAVVGAAHSAPGVEHVDDQLEVDHFA
jgi:osmotically-inducible protein OsmY